MYGIKYIMLLFIMSVSLSFLSFSDVYAADAQVQAQTEPATTSELPEGDNPSPAEQEPVKTYFMYVVFVLAAILGALIALGFWLMFGR